MDHTNTYMHTTYTHTELMGKMLASAAVEKHIGSS